ncbi:MAG TPA: cyclophane-forming radical SAM/SPASM peptide maturase GrrM/OscB [Candidatus Binatia bacterium]|nr:cyclophane-forming radical SAM/SPASM peptide maturase GrrM/OscB [Candidatus Binatia bacterium]
MAQLAELAELAQLAELVERRRTSGALAPAGEAAGEHPRRPGEPGPLDLLVVQPTPFCNLDCDYCYLPDRANKARIAPATLDRLFAWVFESGLARNRFTVVWHAGEPMVLPPAFYAEALAALVRHNGAGVEVAHAFQTNATLVDDAWCDFIAAHGIRIGVSVDGPDFLNDRRRRTRSGRGTHARVVAGMRRLRAHGIPFHVITVLTHASLDYPDEIYDFYVEHGIEEIGFNVEEIEGPNVRSTLAGPDVGARYREFLARFFDLATRRENPLRVREFDSTIAAVLHGGRSDPPPTQESHPFAIVSVDHRGDFTTFSPELLGLASERYGPFALGNVATHSLADAMASPHFAAIARDVAAGIARCRESCAYFPWCGGGAPANKVFENGTFDSTETLFCRLTRRAMLDVVVDKLGPRGAALAPWDGVA